MPDSLAAFTRRMNKLADAIEQSPTEIVAAAARPYTTSIRASIYEVTDGGKLRNVGKNGSRVGVTQSVAGNVAVIQATGPLQIIERDTKDHDIPKTAKNRRVRNTAGRLTRKREATGRVSSGASILVINGNVVTGPVHHPGTKGKHPFERGVNRAEELALISASAAFGNTIARVFNA